MPQTTISTCHSLRLIPVTDLLRFARLRSRISMITVSDPVSMGAIPGSVKISTTSEENGIIKKKISFERSGVNASSAEFLESYKCQRIVAVYVDESGNKRVCGSPDHPLALDYVTGNGVFSVTLQGEDTRIDGFLTD